MFYPCKGKVWLASFVKKLTVEATFKGGRKKFIMNEGGSNWQNYFTEYRPFTH